MKTQIKSKQVHFIEFTDEQAEQLGIKENDQFSLEIQGDSILLTPYSTLDINLAELDRNTLEYIIQQSSIKQVPVDEVIVEIIERALEKYE